MPWSFYRHSNITIGIGRQTLSGSAKHPALKITYDHYSLLSLTGFFGGLLESTRFIQWLFSLSLMNNLFGCTTKNILVIYREHPEAAKNVLATKIIQRLKPLLYKDLMSKLYSLTVAKATESQFIQRLKGRFARWLSCSRQSCKST